MNSGKIALRGIAAFLFPLIAGFLPGTLAAQGARDSYASPYQLVPAVTDPALTPDFRESPKRPEDFQKWSTLPYNEWTNFRRVEELHSTWGPVYRPFAAPPGVFGKGAEWAQLRVIAAAAQIRGAVPYAHHHMHVWNVPDAPPWTDAHYTPGQGIDCSDFTHWAYSYGLGVELHTGIGEQAGTTRATLHQADGKNVEVAAQNLFNVHQGYNKRYADLVSQLQPGDLLFIRGNAPLTDKITHVIIWLGNLATDANGKDKYLVMDSHGAEVTDSNGNKIPSGPQIRPFHEDSWYFRAYDHVVRFAPLKKAENSG